MYMCVCHPYIIILHTCSSSSTLHVPTSWPCRSVAFPKHSLSCVPGPLWTRLASCVFEFYCFFYGFPMVRWWFFVGVQWFSIVSLHVFPREMLSFFKCLFYIFAPARPQTWPWWMVTMAMDRASKNVHLSIFPLTWGCTTSWVVTCGDGLGMVFCHDLQLISVSFWCWAFGFHVLYCLDVPGRALRKPSGTELLRPGMGCSPTGNFHRENMGKWWKMTMNQWRLWVGPIFKPPRGASSIAAPHDLRSRRPAMGILLDVTKMLCGLSVFTYVFRCTCACNYIFAFIYLLYIQRRESRNERGHGNACCSRF